MIISETIKNRAKGKNKSSSWFVNETMNELMRIQKPDTDDYDEKGLHVGGLFMFSYSPLGKNLYFDAYPLVYIVEINSTNFMGINLHYVNPSIRPGLAKTILNKKETVVAPNQTLHKYLFAGVQSPFLSVPEEDWIGISSLPTEVFIDDRGLKYPKHKVWGSSK